MTGTQYSLEQYPHHRNENIRYNDTDRQGHVNNAVFSTFFESSRVSILYDADRGLAKGETEFVIVTFEVEYLKELHWPGEVTIGLDSRFRIERLSLPRKWRSDEAPAAFRSRSGLFLDIVRLYKPKTRVIPLE